jgi:murein DD-endopeptidase MepM/ murein hydrolase activator NlpD
MTRRLIVVATLALALSAGAAGAGIPIPSGPETDTGPAPSQPAPIVTIPNTADPSQPAPIVEIPTVPDPSVPTPSVEVPTVPAPTVPTRSVPTPSVPAPSAPTRSVPTPSAPTPSAPAPSARKPSFSVVSAPAPTPAGQVALAGFWAMPAAQPQQPASDQLLALWQSAGATYGIPWQVLASINRIESNFGRNMGPSSAGAIGWMQFMPGTWQRWGIDADGNGVADPWNATDAIYSAARYLAASGGQTDLSRAIFAYNHAQWYVDEVLRLAEQYGLGSGGSGSSIVFSPQGLQATTSVNRSAVEAQLATATEKAKALARRYSALERRAAAVALLSDRLLLQQRLGQLGMRLDSARAAVAQLKALLASPQAAVSAQQPSLSYGPSLGSGLTSQASVDGYVFPVGGGADVVSVSHGHHDYPAADIAAPQGAPVYALSDAVVLASWSAPDAVCGIGLTVQTRDGKVWTYCHLSYLDPTAAQGAVLSAGASVGLVGSTGDASGPHLHLQLQPPTSYPQQEPWFQAFAGTAYRWQDLPASESSPGPVFAILGQG